MLGYLQALAKAKSLKSRIDKCIETPYAFIFMNKDDEWSIGGEGICYILKETGEAIDGLTYYDNYADYDESERKEYTVE